jgi:hypothetical protein
MSQLVMTFPKHCATRRPINVFPSMIGSLSRPEDARPDPPRVRLNLLTTLSAFAFFFSKSQKLKPTKCTLFR